MKTAATTAIRRPVVAPTATPAVCEVVRGGGLPAAGVGLRVPEVVGLEAGVPLFPVLSLLVLDASPKSDADMELDSSVRALDALPSVVEAMTPAVVELAALSMEVVCNVTASVAFVLEEALMPVPVGDAD